MRALKIRPEDTVATMLEDVEAGGKVTIIGDDGEIVRILQAGDEISMAHKIALAAMKTGDIIIKYGEVIGMATRSIDEGAHIHVHNVDSKRVR